MRQRWRRQSNVGAGALLLHVGRVVAAAALTARLRQRQRQVFDGRLGLRNYSPSKILMQRRWRRGCGDVGGEEEATTAMVDVGWYIVSAK